MDPYEELANAIVLRAVEDYRDATDGRTAKKIEQFFLSEWFSTLTSADSETILNRLRKEKEA